MITIQNTINSAIVYADTIDTGAEGLIKALCDNPVSGGSKIRIMPDVHSGKGCAVGTTMTIIDRVSPNLVGVDIGCGMSVFKIRGKRMELQKFDKLVHESIPAGRLIHTEPRQVASNIRVNELYCVKHVQVNKSLRSIGTLGGGNHFIELDIDDNGNHWLVIHSGSRHLGVEVAEYYQGKAYNQCPKDTPYELAYMMGGLMDNYLHDMAIVQEFAEINRQEIAKILIRGMKWDVIESFSTIHNYIDLDNRILRKGAVSAQLGEKLIIPMNMRDGCLLCTGKGNPEWNYSAPHGAGRLLSRKDARESLTLSGFKKEMKGIYTSSVNRDTLDESPMAYKPMQSILDQIGPTVTVDEIIRPVYNFKAGGEHK